MGRIEEEEFCALGPEPQEEIRAWLRSIGLDPENISAPLVFTEVDGRVTLHAHRYLRDEAGYRYIDHVFDRAASVLVSVDVDAVPGWAQLKVAAQP